MAAELFATAILTLIACLFGIAVAVFYRGWRDMVESEVLFTYDEILQVERLNVSGDLKIKMAYCELIERADRDNQGE